MNASTSPANSGPAALRQAFAGTLQIGAALGGKLPEALSAAEHELVRQHIDVITPENCMKPGPLQPEAGRYDFQTADAFMAYAEQNSLGVVGHCLCWHSQSPAWFFGATMSRKEALAQLQAHIHSVAGRYRGRIQGWDVVNEAILDRAPAAQDFLRDTPALRAIGPDYVERAFEFAREADPSAELYYNDYDIELPAKRERTLRLLDSLLSRGAPVAGVGIQGHWRLDKVPFDDVARAIEIYRGLGLKVMITELDIDMVERGENGADVSVRNAYDASRDIYREGCPEPVLLRQAEQYARLFEIFSAQKGAVSRVTFWGLQDGSSWLNHWPSRRTNHPLLFDRSCRPKPAFAHVLRVAEQAR